MSGASAEEAEFGTVEACSARGRTKRHRGTMLNCSTTCLRVCMSYTLPLTSKTLDERKVAGKRQLERSWRLLLLLNGCGGHCVGRLDLFHHMGVRSRSRERELGAIFLTHNSSRSRKLQ